MVAPAHITVRDFVTQGYLKARPQRPESLRQIYLAIDMLELWHGRPVFCHELEREFLLAFRQWRMQERELPVCPQHLRTMQLVRGTCYGCPQRDCSHRAAHAIAVKPATANKSIRTLVALWNEAVDQGYNTSPKKRIRRLAEELDNMPAWEPGEIAKILAAALLEPNDRELYLCPAADFWPATVLLCYDTSSRITALLRARPDDLDWPTGTLTLRAATTKGKKCDVKKLDQRTLDAVRKIYNPSARLLPCVCTVSTLRDRLKGILERAGLPSSKIHLFHKFRRTRLTQIFKKTRSIEKARKFAGHSHVSVTKRYIDRTKIEERVHSAKLELE